MCSNSLSITKRFVVIIKMDNEEINNNMSNIDLSLLGFLLTFNANILILNKIGKKEYTIFSMM